MSSSFNFETSGGKPGPLEELKSKKVAASLAAQLIESIEVEYADQKLYNLMGFRMAFAFEYQKKNDP